MAGWHLQLIFLRVAAAAWARGSINLPAGGAVFLAKFCIDYRKDSRPGNYVGNIWANLHSPNAGSGQVQYVLFDDESKSYPDGTEAQFASNYRFACGTPRLEHSKRWRSEFNASELTAGKSPSSDIFETIRPRWWYVALLDCSGQERTIDYAVHMTNPKLGWLQEFSMDRCGPHWMYLFLAAYACLSVAQVYALHKQSTTAVTQHPLRIMLTCIVLSGAVGMLFLLMDTIYYAWHGEDQSNLYMLAKLGRAVSKYSLLCVLKLLSQGQGISSPFELRELWRTARVVAPFGIAGTVLEVWGEWSQSRKYTTDFVYVTPMGGVIMLLDLALLYSYLSNVYRSKEAEPDILKREFYAKWGFVYALAFLVLPLSAAVSLIVSPWVRAEAVFLINNFAHIVMLALLVVGLWPDRTQEVFCIDRPSTEAQVFGIKADLLEESAREIELRS
eukprot:TRINITY_DN2533_c0_g2_i1.p1 TRINITY_DN2533_c0_g2~~TRINITY_DN2533_c0_g2_i1.p1  ORF type:complete len:444 (-),score=37.94 TRINITY_DN2533_c0_g2_i1:174-1505(-)